MINRITIGKTQMKIVRGNKIKSRQLQIEDVYTNNNFLAKLT
jgi:hypothetical protein